MWLTAGIVLAAFAALQRPHLKIARAGSLAISGLALSGLVIWLRPLFQSQSAGVDIMEAVLMPGLLIAMALATFAAHGRVERQELASVLPDPEAG